MLVLPDGQALGRNRVNKLAIRRIFESFSQLEKAVNLAKQDFEKYENPPADALARIESYEEILEKQRSLATALCGHSALGNYEEVVRHIKLINSYSIMIRDDAREVIGLLGTERTFAEEQPQLPC